MKPPFLPVSVFSDLFKKNKPKFEFFDTSGAAKI